MGLEDAYNSTRSLEELEVHKNELEAAAQTEDTEAFIRD